MRRTLLLHSLRFAISSESLDLTPWLDVLYAGNELPAGVLPETPRTELAVSLELGHPAATPSVEDEAGAVFAENNLCGGPAYFAGGRFGARIRGNFPQVLEYDPAGPALRAVLGGRFAAEPFAVVGRVIRPLLQSFLLPFHGLLSLHGAVVARDGRGTFIAGAGGAGKTTTALAFAREGWAILSDDGPLLAMGDGGAVALSSLDYLHVSDGTLTMFPDLRPRVVGGRDHRDKYAVPAPRCAETTRPVVVDTCVVLRRGAGGRPRIVPLDRAEVLRRLVAEAMTVFRAPPFRDPVFSAYSRWCLRLIASFVARARPLAVEYGDDHVGAIPALLEDGG